MFKSIFAKYFTVLSAIITVSFAAMGGLQMLLSTRYWVSEKQQLLKENTLNMSRIASQYIKGGENITDLYPYLSLVARTIDSYFFIAGTDGAILLYSDNAEVVLKKARLSQQIIEKLKSGEYFEVGLLDGIYDSRQYSVGVPIKIYSETVAGYVFASTSAEGLSEYLKNNLQVFFLSALGVLALTFIAVYIMTLRMVRPLRQMAAAARSFGMGDFSQRIRVFGRDESPSSPPH